MSSGFSDRVQLKTRISLVVLCLSRGWIVSEKKAKQNDRHRNSASIAGQPDQSSSGVAVKTKTRVLRRVVLYRLPSLSLVQVPSRSRKCSVIFRGTPGRFDAGGVHRLYVREIDEIMQEEETEKLGQAGRTG